MNGLHKEQGFDRTEQQGPHKLHNLQTQTVV